MKVIDPLPAPVRTLENLWIPLSDGNQLAARMWRPDTDEPVPAILEYIPYRKRDLTRGRDAINHPYLAAHGYACVRVDLRGSGDSSGVMRDQFRPREQRDACEVIAWLAAQPWCDGHVGMFGISWGGFAGLQVAARQPPALGAVVAVSATDDLYGDNMHYMGGCLLGDNLSEATTMLAYNACPPDPEIVGDGWLARWRERLEGSGHWLETWLEHQYRDDYWDHGSVREDYAAIRCPVLCASGWADGYSNPVFRLLEHLEVPRGALIGPWSHRYPHLGVPGPAIGFLQEVVRWFDHWLKGIDRGVSDDPMLRVWMQDSAPPRTFYQHRPGRWVAEPSWPSPHIEERTVPFGRGLLSLAGRKPTSDEPIALQSPLSVGLFAGKWCSYAATPDLPGDQREEDGGSLTFDSGPLREPVEILGVPRVELDVAADQPVAMVAVRLSEILPDGKTTRVSFGLLNLTHQGGDRSPQPLEPGRRYRVSVPLNGIAHSFATGNRLRVSLSTSYWPIAWPPPRPTTVWVYPAGCRLVLPQRAPRASDEHLRVLPEAEGARPLDPRPIEPGRANWRVIRDLASDEATLEVIRHDDHLAIDEIDLRIRRLTREWYSSCGDDFDSVRGETRTTRRFERKGWRAETRTRTVLSGDAEYFHLHAQLDAFLDDDRRIHAQTWDRRIRRLLV